MKLRSLTKWNSYKSSKRAGEKGDNDETVQNPAGNSCQRIRVEHNSFVQLQEETEMEMKM